jgi:hypothetical protein
MKAARQMITEMQINRMTETLIGAAFFLCCILQMVFPGVSGVLESGLIPLFLFSFLIIVGGL